MHGQGNRREEPPQSQFHRQQELIRLFGRLGGVSSLSLLYILLLLPVSACMGKADDIMIMDQPTVQDEDYSKEYLINISVDDRISTRTVGSIRKIGVFVYEAEGLRRLISTGEIGEGDSYGFRSSGGDMTVVAIANCPFEINNAAVSKLESIELLRMDFKYDDPDHPVMSGCCTVCEGGCSDLVLRPLMSKVVLTSVSNNMDGYRRLEDPRVYLGDTNPSAELLRNDGFRPDSQETEESRVALPCDVGIFTQYPGTELFCYPNDYTDNIMGTPATALILECEIEGETHSFRAQLPPLPRNRVISVSMTIDGPGQMSYSSYDDFSGKASSNAAVMPS